MMTADFVREATAAEPNRDYHELDRGHFILVEQDAAVRRLLGDWLARLTDGIR